MAYKKSNCMLKKIWYLILVIVLMWSVSACNNEGNDSTDNDNTKLSAYSTGLKEPTAEELMESAEKLKFSNSNYEDLPYTYDLSHQYPTPGSQGEQGSCVGWAVAYALHSQQEMKDHGWTYNDSHLFSPSFVYNLGNDGIDAGMSIPSALKILKNIGSASLATMPYNDADYLSKPSEAALSEGWVHRIADWNSVHGINQIKNAIMNYGGVVIGIPCYPEIEKLNTADPVYDDTSGTNIGGHAICLVGWDNDLQAFKFINSWGTDWGIGGFGYISFQIVDDADRAYYMVDVIEEGKGFPIVDNIVDDSDIDNIKPDVAEQKTLIFFPDLDLKKTVYFDSSSMPVIEKTVGTSMSLPLYDDFDWEVYSEYYDPKSTWTTFLGWTIRNTEKHRLYSDGNGNYKFIYDSGATPRFDEKDGYRRVTVSDGGVIDFIDAIDESELILWGEYANNYEKDAFVDSEYLNDTYTIRFNANGGSGVMSDLTEYTRILRRLPNCSYTMSGYSFTGWTLIYNYDSDTKYYSYINPSNQSSDWYEFGQQPTGYELQTYTDGDIFIAEKGAFELEAIWTPKPIVTVCVSQYDGKQYIDKKTELDVGVKFTFEKEQVQYEGHTLIGWSLFDTTTAQYQYSKNEPDGVIWAKDGTQPEGYSKVIYKAGQVFDGFSQEFAGREMVFWPLYSNDIDY